MSKQWPGTFELERRARERHDRRWLGFGLLIALLGSVVIIVLGII